MNKQGSKAKACEIRKIADLRPDRLNANRHTERGSGMMENSIRECGFGDSLTVDKDGVVISGNQRLETLADIQMEDPIVIQSDGTRPIIHQRTDLSIKDKRARMLAIYQNRVGELNLDWDVETLKSLSEDADLGKFWTEKELALLFNMEMPGMTVEQAHVTLAERFGVPPFSVLDARQGYWQDRKRAWLALGIQSELGRGDNLQSLSESNNQYRYNKTEFFKRAGSKNALHDSKAYASPLDRKRRQCDVTDGANARRRSKVSPGGSPRPASDYSKGQRGDGRGRPIDG